MRVRARMGTQLARRTSRGIDRATVCAVARQDGLASQRGCRNDLPKAEAARDSLMCCRYLTLVWCCCSLSHVIVLFLLSSFFRGRLQRVSSLVWPRDRRRGGRARRPGRRHRRRELRRARRRRHDGRRQSRWRHLTRGRRWPRQGADQSGQAAQLSLGRARAAHREASPECELGAGASFVE